MAKFRRRISDRIKLLAAVTVTGLVILFLQKYPFSSREPQDTEDTDEAVGRRVEELREILETGLKGKENVTTGLKEFPLQLKTVLMHSFPYYYELKSGSGVFRGCDYPCTLTLDPEMVDDVDSVVVYSHGFKSRPPVQRSPQQIWTFFAVESPINWRTATFQEPKWRSAFNWTMTYRRDSDFYFGYGDVVKAPSPIPRKDLSAVAAGKTKLVAWFVSNCHTLGKREDFVEALKEFIPVDVYGGCGPLRCDRSGEKECLAMLSRDYHFYLSFENSLCNDYITEKVYHIIKMADIVPVVRGGSNYTRLLPQHSFVDASKFPSVKALADHLNYIAGNKTLYESYLAWKREWRVIEPVPFSFCELCKRLHHTDRYSRVYPNIDAWWFEGQCLEPPKVIKS